MKQIFMSKFV